MAKKKAVHAKYTKAKAKKPLTAKIRNRKEIEEFNKNKKSDEAFNEFYGRDTAGMVSTAIKASFDIAECDLTATVRQLKEVIAMSAVLEGRFNFRLVIGDVAYVVGVEKAK